MKKILQKLLNVFVCYVDVDTAKTLLWDALQKTIRKTYNPGGAGEDKLFELLAQNYKSVCAIDIGANIGKWSQSLIGVLPDSKIYAVEPVPDFYDKIPTDILVQKFNLALSNKAKTLTIYQSGGGGKPFEKKIKGKTSKAHEIRAITGDEFLKENNINHVDLIKIDTDGFDYEVLSGFSETIASDQPIIQFELSYWWLKMGYTLEQAKMFFSNMDYTLFHMEDDGLRELELSLPESLFITANILAVPRKELDKFTTSS